MSFAVAILGRPNVGKSTLFNRLVGRRLALVDATPGLTRDRREGAARIADLEFRAIDTAGLEEAAPDSLTGRIRAQTERALAAADVALFVIDARAGVTPTDRHFARWLRQSGKPVVLVANKAEGSTGLPGVGEAFALGLGDPLPISAEHGEGLALLYERLLPFAPAAADAGPPPSRPLQLAILGRPNVGKSTLANRLIGADRLLAGPEPGITRDAIAVDWEWQGRGVRLVDTAGLRRAARVAGKVEKLSAGDSLRALRFAEIAILVLDATRPLERQDLAIAGRIEEEGRGLVLAATKWDLIRAPSEALRGLRERTETSLAQLAGVAIEPVSGKSGYGLEALMTAVFAAEAAWNRRVATAELNRWLAHVQQRHPPPLAAGRRLRLRYLTQVNTKPPSFALFASKPAELPDAYRRYVVNALRRDFDLRGTPIRLMLRQGRNPYAAL
jgi:GTP-binding protein